MCRVAQASTVHILYVFPSLREFIFVSFMGETVVLTSDPAALVKELGRQLAARTGRTGDMCEAMG